MSMEAARQHRITRLVLTVCSVCGLGGVVGWVVVVSMALMLLIGQPSPFDYPGGHIAYFAWATYPGVVLVSLIIAWMIYRLGIKYDYIAMAVGVVPVIWSIIIFVFSFVLNVPVYILCEKLGAIPLRWWVCNY